VTNFQAGEYAFELKITDASGLSSKDTVVINVTGTPSPGEVDLDVSLVAEYSFIVNTGLSGDAVIVYAALCQLYGECPPLPLSEAKTSLTKIFDMPNWGQFRFKLDETAEGAGASYNHETSIALTKTNDPSWWASGQCSINFKKLIQAGGGLFNGTCQMSNGSAMRCDQNIFTNLPPLSVSGILDTTTHTVDLTLKGKVYF
jgi:hypothetical protein